MKVTLEQVVCDAAMYGYDFKKLINKLDEKYDIKECVYGYALAKDKKNYLESIKNGKIAFCDKIYLFQSEIDEYLKEFKEKHPHLRIFSGFSKQKSGSLFIIISINDIDKRAFVRELEHINDEITDLLRVWSANLNYNNLIDILKTMKVEELIQKAPELDLFFDILDEIKI